MSAPAELLRDLSAAGVEVRRDGDRLRVRAPKGVITTELLDRLKAEKPRLLEALRPRRVIVRFRLARADGWASAIGAPGMSTEAIIRDLRERHGVDRVEIGGVRT